MYYFDDFSIRNLSISKDIASVPWMGKTWFCFKYGGNRHIKR